MMHLFRICLLGLVCLSLLSCQTTEERRAANLSSDRSKCSSFGFKPGTDGFANCIMQQELTRESARSVRREMEKAAECADLKGTYTRGAAAGILKGFALAMNDCD